MNFNKTDIQTIRAEWLLSKKIALDVLRLDKIHPVVSGNKWFKLKYYLQEAIFLQKTTVATFGGAWSNHIVATAFACKEAGLKCIGFIRGEQSAVSSYTLEKAMACGMELNFITREEYRKKENVFEKYQKEDWYWINEGGYGKPGAKGASEIADLADLSFYSHIVAAVGTGTMLAGLVLASHEKQKIIGISCMKGNFSLQHEIANLIISEKPHTSFQVKHDYHFGGYGKHPPELIEFINNVYIHHNLPLDIVYTGKTFFAVKDLIEKNFFEEGSRVLIIHSGGLQGNKSLLPGVLAF